MIIASESPCEYSKLRNRNGRRNTDAKNKGRKI